MVIELAEQMGVFHDVANIFPMMGEEEFASLVADIRAHGQREPVWTHQGKIIDGRNRYRACQQLGIEPVYREWDGSGSLVAFVVSLNLQRRHLTSSQKAMVALEIEKHLAEEASEKERARKSTFQIFEKSPESIHAAEQAASAVGTNRQYVVDAKKIVEQAPELKEHVASGALTIPEAKTLARLPEQQRTQAIQMMSVGSVKTAKAAVLEIKKSEVEAQVQDNPTKPRIALASWDAWVEHQPLCDLLLTDPPYSTDVDDIDAFAASWLPEALSKVRNGGRAYVCIGSYPHELRAYLNATVPSHLRLAQVLVWTYKNTIGPSPASTYKQNWQAILYFIGLNAPRLDCPLMNEQFSVQEINAPDGRLGDRWHAWQKPDELAERLIRHSTKPGDVVLDCFAGTGTFLLAAHRLGRVASGCDISEDMLRIAERRGCEVAC